MKKITLAVSASIVAGCLASPLQTATPATSSQPATSASPSPVTYASPDSAPSTSPSPSPTFPSGLQPWPSNTPILYLKDADTRASLTVRAGERSILGIWEAIPYDLLETRQVAYQITRSKPVPLDGVFQLTLNYLFIATVAGASATYGALTSLALAAFYEISFARNNLIVAWGTPSKDAIGSTIKVDLDITQVMRVYTKEVFDPAVPVAEGKTLTVVP